MPLFKLEILRLPADLLDDSEFVIQIHREEELLQEWKPVRSWFPLCELFRNLNLPIRQLRTLHVCANDDGKIAVTICDLWNCIINDETDDFEFVVSDDIDEIEILSE